MNGAAIIHDFELAFAGRTSEDVGAGLDDGSFGMAQETGEFLNRAAAIAAEEGRGLGEIVGREISRRRLKHRTDQYLRLRLRGWGTGNGPRCDRRGHHPHASQRRRGRDRQSDVRRFSPPDGGDWIAVAGVVLNLGSAVIMPEVFLKALNLCRNLGRKVRDFTTADMDFLRHYRPRVNVVERPTRGGGRGIMLTGHHEIMFPLLVAAVREELRRGA